MPQEIIIVGTSVLQEVPTSPKWEFGDIVRATQVFRSASHELARASAPPKGTLGVGDFDGLKVVNSEVAKERGNIGVLTIVYEGVLAAETQVPPDKISIHSSQQEFSLDSHPKFSDLNPADIKGCHAYVDAKSDTEARDWQHLTLYTDSSALIERLLKGNDHYSLWPCVYEWSTHHVHEPVLHPGGIIEVPFGPATPPPGYQWLRAGDDIDWDNGYWALTRRWIAAFTWDSFLYPPTPP